MHTIRQILVLAFVWIIPMQLLASSVSSNGMGAGAWSAAQSWDIGVPGCVDSIAIRSGDVVSIGAQQDYSTCPLPIVLVIDGTLLFPGNGPKLWLPAGSTIIINAGGLISATGSGNGNKIDIGGTWVWEKKDGDVPGYACFGNCSPLPVRFLSVEAIPKEKAVCVNWTTLTESNNDYFTVERSSNGTQYQSLLEVHGAGTSNAPLQYTAKDLNPLQGLSYCRIKQTDYDGTFDYSEVVAIEVAFMDVLIFSIHPNPIRSSENLQLVLHGMKQHQSIVVELRDLGGELKHIEEFTALKDGIVELTVATQKSLRTGLYILSISTPSSQEIHKLAVR
ncbi:MAG: hypothetical protein JKX73_09420 [Flavobacteriales bacterium]|nr:hypothetical protein [Flavobacteriales bacterium]